MAKSKGRGNGPTTQAVTVGVTRTGKFGNRVGGLAGREASGGRTGMTDAAVSAGSKAYGRSAPATGVGGAGGSDVPGIVENTNQPGGGSVGGDPNNYIDPTPGGSGSGGSWTDYADPVPEPSVTPVYKNPPLNPITRALPPTREYVYAPTPPQTQAPATAPTSAKTTTPTTPRTQTPSAPSSGAFVTPIGGQYAPAPAPSSGAFVTPIGGQYAPTPSITPVVKSPTVNPYTGFVTSPTPAPAPVPTMAQRIAALNAQTYPTVNSSTGFTTKPAATTAPVVVKGQPAPTPVPAPKPANTIAPTSIRRVAS